MKNKNSKNVVKILKRTLSMEEGVLFCYLFGSLAYGNYTSKSDIDLAVYLDKAKVRDFFEKRLELMAKISKALKNEVDVVVLNTAAPFLKYVILKEGKLVFEKDKGEKIDFELKSINEYFDFKPFLERHNKRLLVS